MSLFFFSIANREHCHVPHLPTDSRGLERIRMAVGGNCVHILFRGDPPVFQDLLGGRLDFAATAVISASVHTKAPLFNSLKRITADLSADEKKLVYRWHS